MKSQDFCNILSFLFLASIGLMGLGCAKLRKSEDNRTTRKVKSINFSSPKKYQVEDTSCWRSDQPQKLGTFKVHSFVDGKSAEIAHEFSGASSNTNKQKSLGSALISGTAYGYHSRKERNCAVTAKGALGECSKPGKPEKISVAKYLRICEESGAYERDSIEGVSLSAMAHLENAQKSYLQLEGKTSLGKSWLFVMPNYEDIWHLDNGKKRWDAIGSKTDNAAFSVTPSGEQLYVIYPKSIDDGENKSWKNINLWEVPWVMAHEFSHNIFTRHYSMFTTDAASKTDDESEIWSKSTQPLPSSPSFGIAKKRAVKVGDALSAINEGFADLMAFYLVGAQKELTKGLPCMAKIRSIHLPKFPKGGAKVLSDKTWKSFASEKKTSAPDDCEALNPQDVHHIGAIVARQFHRLFETVFEKDAEDKAKAQLALNWLKAFDKLRVEQKEVTFDKVFELAILASAQVVATEDKLSENQCNILVEGFPHFSKFLASQGQLGCEFE